jgi:hypothetical protein
VRLFIFEIRFTESFAQKLSWRRTQIKWAFMRVFWGSRLGRWYAQYIVSKRVKEFQASDWPPLSYPETFGYATNAKPRPGNPDMAQVAEVERILKENQLYKGA